MSIQGNISNSSPFFHEFKKQASFFFKEKIKTARLALTDVTPAELLTEESTNGNPGGPDTRSLKIISKAAFEVDDFWRIVEIMHKRLVRFDRNNWRLSYKSVIVLEHLLTHGPESIAEEFQSDKDVIREMGSFQHIDEKGFNWGLNVRKKSERILKLLEKGPLLKEERLRSRKLTRGIEGFGSFSQRATPSGQDSSTKTYGKCNSQFNEQGTQDDQFSSSNDENVIDPRPERSQKINDENQNSVSSKKFENLNSWDSFRDHQKENMAPREEVLSGDLIESNCNGESKHLLNDQKNDGGIGNFADDDFPFNDDEHLSTVSLISTTDQSLKVF